MTRRWNASPFAVETSMNACGESGRVEARIITPILVHGWDPLIDATRAMMVRSPVSDW